MPNNKYVIVVNPKGGTQRGLSVLQEVEALFADAGAEFSVHPTTSPGHAAELAKTVELTGCDGLCVIGGDGTIHETVCGMMEREADARVPLGFVPGGTGNSVCQHLNIRQPLDAAQRILRGNTQPLDVAHVALGDEVIYCVNIIGWGAAVDINRTAERLRWLGTTRYSLSAIAHILRARRRRARVVLDDQVVEDDFMLIIACNTKYTGKGMLMAPKAETHDGKFDVVLVRHATRWQMLQLFRRVFDGSHLSLPWVEYHQVQRFGIEPDTAADLNLDGELKGRTPVLAKVIPGGLRIFA